MRVVGKIALGVLALVVLLVLLAVFFPWDLLRGPVNRYVSEKTGRHFEITRHLDVKLGRTTRVLADGIEIANPDWASDRYLVRAEGAEIHVHLLPLLKRRIELPLISLHKPELGLQMEADGRRSWAFGGKDSSDPRNVPQIGALVVDRGSAHFISGEHGADILANFAIDTSAKAGAGGAMPLQFDAKGTWQKEAFSAKGRTGNVLHLSKSMQEPFPMEVQAQAGHTTLGAKGQVASLATLEGASVRFDLQGQDLADLYKFLGVVLPNTPRYALQGDLTKDGDVWRARSLNGKLGNSDIAGHLDFDRRGNVPHLVGKLASKSLDFNDLAPVVGLPEQGSSAAALPKVKSSKPVKVAKAPPDPNRRVLPKAPIDLSRLAKMNADVTYAAAKISHVETLPLDRASVHVLMKDGVLTLDPLDVGVAGGRVAGRIVINGKVNPAVVQAKLDARSMQLNRLFPKIKLTKGSLGKVHGDFDLKGRGNTVAQMLGSSSGDVALVMGPGEFSNLLLEVAGLDGGEILKFLGGHDRNVNLRCAAAAFDVNDGLMTSRVLVLDTVDTVIYGDGRVNLATEAMDISFRPYPKDMSILSLRSPLHLAGTFGAPKAGVDRGALGGRAGLALALGAINPLLALAATVETGPGKDANCGAVLRDAASPDAQSRIDAMAREQQKAMGGSGEKKGLVDRLKQALPKGSDSRGQPLANQATGPHAPGAPARPYGD